MAHARLLLFSDPISDRIKETATDGREAGARARLNGCSD
jgi:hypothetical protein